MTLRVFMARLVKALKTKTGKPATDVNRSARKIYAVIVAYAKTHPDRLEWLSRQVDFLPRGWELVRYLATIKDIVQDEFGAERERERRGRRWSSSTPDQQQIGSIVSSLVGSMTSRRR